MRSVLALLILLVAGPLRGQECRPARVALVLSGGGAKGLAHIGVVRVLDSLGVKPDLIVGTSMGAVIGGMYASGYSGREIDSLARSLPLASLFRTYQPRAPRSLGQLQPLVLWEQSSAGFVLQTAAIHEPEANSLINAAMLRGNLIARGDFNALPIPFRAVATDLRDRSAVVLGTGDLARAVRASVAIPLIVPPESLGARLLVDGGLSANIPVAIARKAGATRVIVSDATERGRDSVNYTSPISLADRLRGFLFEQPLDSLAPDDVRIRPDINGFASLDFAPERVAALIERGTEAARAALAGVTCLPHGTIHAPPAPTRIDTVVTPGARPAARLALLRILGLEGPTLDVQSLRAHVHALSESETFDAIWLGPTGGGDTIRFDLEARPAPRRAAGLGVVFDNEMGGRMWVGVVDRHLLGLTLEGTAALFLGELRRELAVGLRRPYELAGRLVTPTLTAAVATESVRRFDADHNEIPAFDTREIRVFAGIERELGGGWAVAAGGAGVSWREPAIGDAHAAGGLLRVERLDRSATRSVLGEAEITPTVERVRFTASPSIRAGAIGFQPVLRLGWGRRLPLQYTFALGGTDGFPGAHIGEVRGDREAMAGISVTVAVKGPLVITAEAAAGRSATGGPLLGSDGWMAGGRAGVGADTPIGPVRVDYGRATGGREALRVRLGRWF
jgi:NTE family protein